MKIGFLAMSGVRAHDKKLLELGLTLPGFVERSRTIASLPSLGLLYLAARTPAGHEMRYFEAESNGAEAPEVYSCDLVAISTFSAQIFEAYAIADRLRKAGVKVALGGLHVSVLPEEALDHADYVVTGEGENVWPAVVAAATRAAPPAIFRAADFEPVDIAQLPVPRFDLLGHRTYNRYTIQTTRGCPWRCDFCASTVMLQAPYRRRPVDQVVRDIRVIEELHPQAFIEFADDNTFVDKPWGKELCRALVPLKVKWFTETDVSVAEDAELLELMHQAGCRQVLIGLESPSAGPLAGLEQRADRKARWAARYVEAVGAIQSHGVTVNACFILGLDGQTTAVFGEILQFVEEVAAFDVQITLLTPFPGTPLYERLRREGRLLEPGAWHLCTLFDVNYQPAGMTPQELREGIYWLGEHLYGEEATRRRRKGFFSQLNRERNPV
ncbi:MAG: B12-binding domain-containing radical SAM protein [Verrucomicrobia bacterium]|nr:B12-binding domain-containing radical SAM protein [Verrucomicrobiota bacterium]